MNQTLIALLIAVAPAVLMAQLPEYVPTQNLVGWYPFDDGANDLSGNGYDGTAYGASVIESPINGALFFDGENDYVEIPTNAEFENMVDELTLSAWFYKTNDQNGSIMGKRNFVGNPCGERHHFELLCHSDRSIKFSAQHNCVELHTSQVISESEIFELDEWNHIVVTYDNGLVKFYLNGELVLTHNEGYRELLPNNHWINFGRIHRSGGQAFFNEFGGLIDESGIWSRALSEQEAQNLFQRQIGDTSDSDDEPNQEDPFEELTSGCELFSIQTLAMQNLILLDSIATLNAALANASSNSLEDDTNDWSCGDPIAHEGHEYGTTQIGNQCWFAENVRVLPAVWPSTAISSSDPRAYVYSFEGESLAAAAGQEAYQLYGALYNYPARQQWPLCPSQWSVPTDEDWFELESHLGIEAPDLDLIGLRGSDQGTELKSTTGWNSGGAGTDLHGFNGLPGGELVEGQGFIHAGLYGFWGTSSLNSELDKSWFRELPHNHSEIYRHRADLKTAMSVRCVRD